MCANCADVDYVARKFFEKLFNFKFSQVPTLFKLAGEIVKDSTGHVAKLKLAELFPETELVSFHDKKM